MNSGDNQGAASLFAKGAEIVQGGTVLRLDTEAEAVAWNAALPCSGRVVSITVRGDTADATFQLGEREKGSQKCDGPGKLAAALFRVRNGKIVLWHQAPTDGVPTGPPV